MAQNGACPRFDLIIFGDIDDVEMMRAWILCPQLFDYISAGRAAVHGVSSRCEAIEHGTTKTTTNAGQYNPQRRHRSNFVSSD
jgi:hypothetical protein